MVKNCGNTRTKADVLSGKLETRDLRLIGRVLIFYANVSALKFALVYQP